ncbi:thiamine pyrophosphate-binding protein [Micromonospora sp. HUAS LYJ1]|uniref:thiamine pyrophosphate-binding protein n=1 Tax=Micromonospora sp. HUAS LYJ1 TaxID=3061626 RepID=UPI0026738A5E|nr:thiamine pyrophosphate-binding protein [Micromonospora sp. HUAS LYJ1]WKU05561.1 thiamine pyrophosphate-binding protein [Micromonospora sp. HUAS LYJ1]
MADVILRCLAANRVTHVFGVPGGPLFAFYAALARQDAVRSVLAKHEEGAAFMALGYAQAGGGLGMACTTTSPGATNALTGIASATSDSVPVLLLTAQIATDSFGRGALQDSSGGNWSLDVVDTYRSATKLSAMPAHPAHLPRLARHAIRTALHGRPGAAHLNVPADLLPAAVPTGPLDVDTAVTVTASAPDPAAVAELARQLTAARRPVLLAGQGAKLAKAGGPLVRLAEWGGIPVATTIKGKSVFPEDHPLSLGTFGFGGHPAAHDHLLSDEVDLVVVVGSGLGELATHGWHPRLLAGRRVAHVDVDPLQIGKHFPTDVGVVGDADAVLRALLERLPTAGPGGAGSTERIVPRSSRYYRSAALQAGHDRLRASAVVARLSEVLPPETLIFADNGNCLSWLGQYFVCRTPGEIFVSLNVGAMGYASGAAIGGKFARPERPVVALVGDAAFAMNGMELHTAVEYEVPIVWVILNNGGHGMVHNVQSMMYQRSHDALFRHPIDIASVARGLGAAATTVTRLDDLDPAVTAALVADRPHVIDVIVDPEEVPWALRGRAETLRAASATGASRSPASAGTPSGVDHAW